MFDIRLYQFMSIIKGATFSRSCRKFKKKKNIEMLSRAFLFSDITRSIVSIYKSYDISRTFTIKQHNVQ